MKKFLSLLSLSLLIGLGVVNAQNQRTVVLECFTSTTCGPCAAANPALDNIINNNTDKLIAIKYHVNWPSAGDPMNLHNPGDVSSKVSFYGINAVPYSVGDGTWIGNSSSVNQNLVNQWAAVESPIEMRMTHYFNAAQDTMFVVVMGKATSAINSNNLKLNISVIEKTMEYASAPGSNGERIFHNVMKKLLPGAAGTSIAAMEAGDYFAYKYSWALANVMNISELTAVAWLQDSSTKQMIQGCKSSEDYQPFYEKQSKIAGIDHTKKHICSGNVAPDIFVDNFGSETINSLTINIKLNGEDLTQVAWEGNIPFGRQAKISLGDLGFSADEANEMLIEIAAINGTPDDYAVSVYSYLFNEPVSVTNTSFKLQVRTDDDPQSITWDIVNTTTGDVVISGGPYEEANKIYTTNFTIETSGCYMFTIYDAGGNGLSGANGVYALKSGNTTLTSGSQFNDKESDEFSLLIADIAEYAENKAIVYPNPTQGMLTIDTEECGYVGLYNMAGQMVLTQKIEGKTVLNISGFEKGTYLLVLTDENGNGSRQVIVLQ